VDGIAAGIRSLGGRLRLVQRGSIQESLTLVFVAAIILLAILLILF
jgi:hypothetical protein